MTVVTTRAGDGALAGAAAAGNALKTPPLPRQRATANAVVAPRRHGVTRRDGSTAARASGRYAVGVLDGEHLATFEQPKAFRAQGFWAVVPAGAYQLKDGQCTGQATVTAGRRTVAARPASYGRAPIPLEQPVADHGQRVERGVTSEIEEVSAVES